MKAGRKHPATLLKLKPCKLTHSVNCKGEGDDIGGSRDRANLPTTQTLAFKGTSQISK